MALTVKELEKQLTEAGNQLLSPPSSVTQLKSSIDQVESLLLRVEQSPSESMRKALSPSMKALIAHELLRHSDVDVKVAVAACISEITRITAPDAPYEDDQMKEVFQLIVSSFEKLDDLSSPSYIRRTTILETVAKVRSCVVMLDLECDALIAEMFQHFFRCIRSEHPENVFSSMETIMTLVLEESEDVSVDLVSSILNVLKKENKDVLPVARQLGEKVIESCFTKIEPCLEKAMKSLHTTQDDYSKVVTNIFKEKSEATETRDTEAASKNVIDEKIENDSTNEPAKKVSSETVDNAPHSGKNVSSTVGSPKSVAGNGTLQKDNEDTSAGYVNKKEADNEPLGEEAEPGKTKVEKSDAEQLIKLRIKTGKVNKRKGKKTKSSKSSKEPSEPPITDEKDSIAMPEFHEKDDNKNGNAQHNSPVVDTAEPADTEKEPEAPVILPKKSDEPVDVPSSSPSGILVDENASKKVETGEKKDELVEDVPADDQKLKESDVSKSTEEASVSQSKSLKRTGKKVSSAIDKEDSAPSSAGVSKKEGDKTSELDDKSAKQSGKKVKLGSQREDRKKGGKGKGTPTKDLANSPANNEGKKTVGSLKSAAEPAKDESDVEKEFNSNPKRKRSGAKKIPKAPKYGEEVVGKKVEVWWPDDQAYYAGIIEHFDPSTGKHKVTYNDGDVEVLNLAKEKFKLVDGSTSNQGQSSDGEIPDEPTEMPKAKKAKTSPVVGAKQGKTEASPKKGGTSSSKSKSTPKPQSKPKEDKNKSGSKVKDETLISIAKSEGKKAGKTKDTKSSSSTPKSLGKSKDNEVEPSKGSNKSKQETPKTVSKSKAKSPKTGSKSEAKAAPPEKEDEDEEMRSSPEPVKAPEMSKGKSGTKSPKSSNKRKRGSKG